MNVLKTIRGTGMAGMLLAGAMFAGFTATQATAQDAAAPSPAPMAAAGGGHHAEAAERMKELSDRLGLTPEQQKVFRESMMDEHTRMKALKDDTTTDRKDKRKQMMQIRADAEATRRAALTDDQKPKYDAWVAETRENMRKRGGAGEETGAPPATPPPPAE